ncbi:N-acetylhexosaminidase [Trametes versicolor FP-101664 SS1]|uniref:N-acetylhexosaminidase n=1 Tax=Trametes versicolor (strain FP-101664) TaxID=717944 RepID=UPI0004622EAF|nr:N-acetylhexosaminidase [Trametes versicolor FP-101664 SS1]EIW52408.1 N-acetylhexosaminidase [Trametes versicolor FP-101664 SS1]
MKLTGLLLALAHLHGVLGLWPLPRSLQTGSSALKLASNFDIHVNVAHAPSDLEGAVSRTKAFLKNDKLGRLVVGRGTLDNNAVQRAGSLRTLELSLAPGSPVRSITDEARLAIGTRSEEYTLHIPADGSTATLTANSTLGLLRGLTTFEQLWYESSGQVYTMEAPVSISDSPAYPFRGFMLDTSRNFFPVSDIQRTLDAMSWVKMSQFHWHVTDSQSFPLEVPGFTELASKGAYDASMVYSPGDVQDIVAYAGARGIDVMVEIDTPGHTAIISAAHPEHIACAEASPWTTFANEPPAGQLRLASPATTNFTADLLASVARMFSSSLMSTGGDELNTECYVQDAQTQADLKASGRTLEQALDVFTQTTHAAIRAEGKTPAVWEEMVLEHNVTLGNDTVVMVWISSANAAAVAAKNFRIVHGPSDFFYLDCGAGEWIGDDVANSWCDPFKTWQKSYTFDPQANISASQAHLVLGGEQLLWTEQSGPENLDSIVWPRAASSAEVFWSGPGGNSTTALPRLHDLAFRMRQRGVKAIPLQPLWCALRNGQCNINS